MIAAAALLTCVAVSGDQLRRDYWQSEAPTFRTLAAESLRTTQPALVFVGSSHVYTGVDPSQFSVPAINLSDSCLNYECGEMLCRHFWSRVAKAKCVVIELDSVPAGLDTIHLRRGDLREFWQWGITGRDLPQPWWEQFKAEFCRYSGAGGAPPFAPRSRTVPLDVAGPSGETSVLRPGFFGRVGSLDPARKEAFFANMGDSFDPRTIEANRIALKRLIQELRGAGVRVVLFRLPLHDDYWNHPISGRREELVAETLAALRSEFDGDELDVIDLSRHPGLTDTDFSDWTHLSVSGAEKVSRELDRRLRVELRDAATPL